MNDIFLKLTPWESKNLHLPAITTLTYYKGEVSLTHLRERIKEILELNPWLTSRLQKTKNGYHLKYNKSFDSEELLKKHFEIYNKDDFSINIDLPYEEINQEIGRTNCAPSKQIINTDEVMFKISLIPVTKNQFAIVISLNHTLGDGATYYSIFEMLSSNVKARELTPTRLDNFEIEKSEIMGKVESKLTNSLYLILGIIFKMLGNKLSAKTDTKVGINKIDLSVINKIKKKAKEVNFVSTNDILTSWFFQQAKSDTNFMVANFRNRKLPSLSLTENNAGNYQGVIPYFNKDITSPSHIRKSIINKNGSFRAKRAFTPKITFLQKIKFLKSKTSLITNWSTFYKDLILTPKTGEEQLSPILHYPIVELNSVIASSWNCAIIFRPKIDELAILVISSTKKLIKLEPVTNFC